MNDLIIPERALTIRQPFAYLAGVLHGDGWLTPVSLGLRVADRDFAETFSAALRAAYERDVPVRIDERGYFLARTSGNLRQFALLKGVPCTSPDTRSAWLRGLFDSEGNAQLLPKPARGPRSWDRRVSFYSTDQTTLDTAEMHLGSLGMPCIRSLQTPSEGHIGSKPVWELKIRSSREHYARFAQVVGSSISRKRAVLDALPGSYQEDRSAYCREAQLRGAQTRRARTDARLGEVLDGIRRVIAQGIPPTEKELGARIPGFWSQKRRYRTTRLVEMACAH
jgi:hypothetical protein